MFDKVSEREMLPGGYESKYKSEVLKAKIADLGMWSCIPAVTGNIDSPSGLRRLKQNHLLFSFIDEFFPDGGYDFEPNMRDGRFVFLPADVGHQGMGILVSNELPGFFEIGHFWYPCEFTEKTISMGSSQVYIPMFSTRSRKELEALVRRIYFEEEKPYLSHYCTFPFMPDAVVTLEGNFLDRMDESVKKIRNSLINTEPKVRRNGEGLIEFMRRIMDE